MRALVLGLMLTVPWFAPGCASLHGGRGRTASFIEKHVSFAVLEDYDKGQDLAEVDRDFALLRELDVDEMRCSLGWDDYEPEPGRYDFAWLEQFVDLARRRGIALRPYLAYTPAWAGKQGQDDQDWNNPPADASAWERFVRRLAGVLRKYPNVLSYEIYNEENVPEWWDGTAAEYARTLVHGAAAVRAADPGKQVLLGGMVFPDASWIREMREDGAASSIDVIPFHAYPETWTPESVRVENYLGPSFRRDFLPACDSLGLRPIWINETGFATTEGRSERDQANWWARAVATFLAEPRVEHIGIYEIKDLRPESEAIGGEANYHLGLTGTGGHRKLAFATIDLLTDLLDTGTLTVADAGLKVTARSGPAQGVQAHLFVRPDGTQVLFLWNAEPSSTRAPVVDVEVPLPASRARLFALDGSMTQFPVSSGGTLRDVRLEPGEVTIFRLDP